MFKKMRGINLPHDVQGLIFFTCRNYRNLPQEKRIKIEELCCKIGKEDDEALLELLTTNKSVVAIAREHYIDESKLYRMRKQFYESWQISLL